MLIRVIDIIADSGTGGSEEIINELIKRLDRRTIQVCGIRSFLCPSVQLARFARRRFCAVWFISSPRVSFRFAPQWARWLDKLSLIPCYQ